MIGVRPGFGITLAIHPNSHGFGWIAFEGPFTPYDWGPVRVTTDKNANCLRRAERLFDRLSPETLVLEAAEPTNSRRVGRITKLTRALTALAESKGVEVSTYSFPVVQSCFAHIGATDRREIAEAIARQFDVLQRRLPKKRRAWDTEREALAIYSAAALILTRLQCGAAAFSDEKLGARRNQGETAFNG